MNRLLIKKEAANADVTTSYNIMGIFYVDIYFLSLFVDTNTSIFYLNEKITGQFSLFKLAKS